jgi:aspartate carbamoyltransferase catalytic subunit
MTSLKAPTKVRHLLGIEDLSVEEIRSFLDAGKRFKKAPTKIKYSEQNKSNFCFIHKV